MSVSTATVIAMLGVIFFLHLWQRDLPRSTVWNVGLKYLFKGVTIGLLLPVLAYASYVQDTISLPAGQVAALQAIVDVVYSVGFWLFIVVLFFLVLGFTFDMLSMKKVNT
jgi:uncharacterized membrane protein